MTDAADPMRGRAVSFRAHEQQPLGERVRVEVDGRLVSWMQTYHVRHRLRGAVLPSCGVVGVHTADADQRRGHMRFMLEAVLDRAAARGYPLSTLHGVPDLYHRWAYATVMPEFRLTVAAAEAAAVPQTQRTRPGTLDDYPAIVELYNRETANLSGSRVRDPHRRHGPRQGVDFARYETLTTVVLDGRGRLSGYTTRNETTNDLIVADAQAASTAAAAAVIASAAAEALDLQVERLHFHVHPQSRVGRYLRNLDLTMETRRPVGQAQMARLNLPGEVLAAVQPHVTRRARALPAPHPSRIDITTELGSGTLSLDGQAPARAVHLPAARLAELLFGYRSADDLRAVHGLDLPRSDAALLDALFPPTESYCYWPDRY